MTQPTIGRIVHYFEKGMVRAAIIVWVGNAGESVNLCVFNHDGTTEQVRYISYGHESNRNNLDRYWIWPERV